MLHNLSAEMQFKEQKDSRNSNNYVWCQLGTRNIRGNTLYSIWLSNHYTVHLKWIQNNIECRCINTCPYGPPVHSKISRCSVNVFNNNKRNRKNSSISHRMRLCTENWVFTKFLAIQRRCTLGIAIELLTSTLHSNGWFPEWAPPSALNTLEANTNPSCQHCFSRFMGFLILLLEL